MKDKVIIFSDGSSKGNPGPGGFGAIVSYDGKVIELGEAEKHTTNNRMELQGAIRALKHLKDIDGEIILNTDSSYVINGITGWVFGWQKNNWKTSKKEDVINKDLWEELIQVSHGKNIKWNYVGGHIGVPGNERCDEIAQGFADGKKPELFQGKNSGYKVDLSDTTGSLKKKTNKSNQKVTAYSYLSLVNGVLKIDKTWAECEKRVKGVKGARFKKSVSEEDEKEIIREWGIK